MKTIILFILLWSTVLKAEPTIDTNHKYYLLNTISVSTLLSDLNSSSPIKENGEVFHGYTDTDIKWNFLWETNHGRCKINKVSTSVKITYTLPKLKNNNNNKPLNRIWRKWYPALIKHEKNHAKNAINIARKIEQSIMNLPSQPSCNELENMANMIGHNLIKKLNSIDLQYDSKTNHGKSEGASILPYL